MPCSSLAPSSLPNWVCRYEQTTATQLSGLPGRAAEYTAASALGRTNRYMACTAATKPLGLARTSCAITSVADVVAQPASGRRRLRRAGSVRVGVSITSGADISAALEGPSNRNPFASRSVRRALLMPKVNPLATLSPR